MTDIKMAIEKIQWRIRNIVDNISTCLLLEKRKEIDLHIKDLNIALDVLNKLKEVENEPIRTAE